MNHKLAIVTAAGLVGGLLTACGSGNNNVSMTPTPPPPMSTGLALDSSQVLALARQASETAAPFAVNAGALTLTDTSETSEPISLTGM